MVSFSLESDISISETDDSVVLSGIFLCLAIIFFLDDKLWEELCDDGNDDNDNWFCCIFLLFSSDSLWSIFVTSFELLLSVLLDNSVEKEFNFSYL